MKSPRGSTKVTRERATEWATWFRSLSDPSRVLILNLLATKRGAMTVGEIVKTLDIGQSTVSHHLRILTETCFVLVERRGTASYFSINETCLDEFPSAAAVVMGQVGGSGRRRSRPTPPWAPQPDAPVLTTSGRRVRNKGR
ncbi:MAG: winged helix-turn-helix transcriptional regulator [Actinobacteria bacterium]|nr:winged helix-turn-helix transcriptional regulator [Actinomycetota bacterium]